MYLQVPNIKITFGIKNIFGQNLSSPSTDALRGHSSSTGVAKHSSTIHYKRTTWETLHLNRLQALYQQLDIVDQHIERPASLRKYMCEYRDLTGLFKGKTHHPPRDSNLSPSQSVEQKRLTGRFKGKTHHPPRNSTLSPSQSAEQKWLKLSADASAVQVTSPTREYRLATATVATTALQSIPKPKDPPGGHNKPWGSGYIGWRSIEIRIWCCFWCGSAWYNGGGDIKLPAVD